MSKLTIFELFLSVGNLKPKLEWFFKPKCFLLNWAPDTGFQHIEGLWPRYKWRGGKGRRWNCRKPAKLTYYYNHVHFVPGFPVVTVPTGQPVPYLWPVPKSWPWYMGPLPITWFWSVLTVLLSDRSQKSDPGKADHVNMENMMVTTKWKNKR